MLYINQAKLEHMLQLVTHQEVVSTIVKKARPDKFYVIRNDNDGWTAVIPKDIKHHMPALCVHTDTVFAKKPKEISKIGSLWHNNDGISGLGADDRAGCYIVKELITRDFDNFIYLIFDQEEVGGIGSTTFSKSDEFNAIIKDVSCFIGLDRRGMNQMAYYGYESAEFCSVMSDDDWVEANGSFTDCSVLAETTGLCCVNLSVGYNNEHTKRETLELSYLGVTLNKVAYGLPDALYGRKWEADDYSDYDDRYDYMFGEYYFCEETKRYVEMSSGYDAVHGIEDYDENLEGQDDFLTKGA